MSMYKKAAKANLMFETTKGILNLHQVFNLSIAQLKQTIVLAHGKIKPQLDEELSFLEDNFKSKSEDYDVLRFDILKDIYNDKVSEIKEATEAKSKKEHNDKIMALIAKKQEESLDNLSEDELRALLKK